MIYSKVAHQESVSLVKPTKLTRNLINQTFSFQDFLQEHLPSLLETGNGLCRAADKCHHLSSNIISVIVKKIWLRSDFHRLVEGWKRTMSDK